MVLLSLIIALIGAVLATIGFIKPLTIIYSPVPLALDSAPDALPMVKTAATVAVEVLETPWNIGSFLLFGLGIGLIAYYALRTATGSKWLNWVGIIGGISGIVWLQAYLPFLQGDYRLVHWFVSCACTADLITFRQSETRFLGRKRRQRIPQERALQLHQKRVSSRFFSFQSLSPKLSQRLRQIGDNILSRFQAYRQTHQTIMHTNPLAMFRRQNTMGHGGWMLNKRIYIA